MTDPQAGSDLALPPTSPRRAKLTQYPGDEDLANAEEWL